MELLYKEENKVSLYLALKLNTLLFTSCRQDKALKSGKLRIKASKKEAEGKHHGKKDDLIASGTEK